MVQQAEKHDTEQGQKESNLKCSKVHQGIHHLQALQLVATATLPSYGANGWRNIQRGGDT
jgi:hypothetical protein